MITPIDYAKAIDTRRIIVRMNTEFFQRRIQGDGAMPASGMNGLARVMRQALRYMTRRTPTELEIAIQKRQLEKKLRANGFGKRLAKIAVSETYSTAKPI